MGGPRPSFTKASSHASLCLPGVHFSMALLQSNHIHFSMAINSKATTLLQHVKSNAALASAVWCVVAVSRQEFAPWRPADHRFFH